MTRVFENRPEGATTPTGWPSIPLKYLFRRSKTLGTGEERLLSIYRDYGVIPKDSRDDNFNKPSDDLSKYQVVSQGDLVVNKMKAWQGSVAVSEYDGIISPAYFVYRPMGVIDGRFAHYLLRSNEYFQYYASISSGVRPNQWDLDPRAFERLEVTIPSHEEQHAIADYLDRETAEIDKLSAEAKSLIGLAAERGTALAEKLIWGLNVPFIRLKFTADILSGHSFKSAHFRELSEDTTPLLRGINVSPHGVNWDSAVAIPSSEAGEFSDYTLQEGDLVLGLDRPIIGSGLRLAKIDKIDAGSLLVQRVARIRSKDPSTSNDWIKAALNSSRFKAHLEPDFTGVSVPHMSPRQLSEFAIPIPPIDVQNEILSQVHAEEIAVRSSIHDLQTLVTMLNERRGALISAAVTGQIDVTAQGESATEQLQDELEVPL